MNIHPFFVHFPIALLTVYSLLELGSYFFLSVRRQAWVFPVKAFLLFVGVLAALVALATGGIAEDLIEGTTRSYILEVHSSVAGVTTLLYVILAATYLVRIFDVKGWGARIASMNRLFAWSWNIKRRFWNFFLNSWLMPFVALLALIGIIITGALGAAIVYGPDIDPAVSFIYHLFLVQ